MVETITWKTKGKAKERSTDTQLTGTKEGRELVPFVLLGNYLMHIPSNVTCM
jgi:hypothetical protein